MAGVKVFDKYFERYDAWFENNKFVYESELGAVKKMVPKNKNGVEIGVGTGRFAVPLGIKIGIEPSKKMGDIARKKDISVTDGTAEKMHFKDSEFDFALMVTTVCFLDNINAAFKEAWRIIKPGGFLIIGLVDKKSSLGRFYFENRRFSPFYRNAVFYSVDEIVEYLKVAGFKNFRFVQTIFKKLENIKNIEPVKSGYGTGSFVVIKAGK